MNIQGFPSILENSGISLRNPVYQDFLRIWSFQDSFKKLSTYSKTIENHSPVLSIGAESVLTRNLTLWLEVPCKLYDVICETKKNILKPFIERDKAHSFFTLIISFVSLGNFFKMKLGFANEMLNNLLRVDSSKTWHQQHQQKKCCKKGKKRKRQSTYFFHHHESINNLPLCESVVWYLHHSQACTLFVWNMRWSCMLYNLKLGRANLE